MLQNILPIFEHLGAASHQIIQPPQARSRSKIEAAMSSGGLCDQTRPEFWFLSRATEQTFALIAACLAPASLLSLLFMSQRFSVVFFLLVVFNKQKLGDISFQRQVVFTIKSFLSSSQLSGKSTELNEVKLWLGPQSNG